MREIKFRIWDKKYRTFDYNASPELFISTDGEVFEKDTVNFAMQTYDEYNKADHYELNQYTGLKDMNGKEIYEGDVVKIKHTYDYQTREGYDRGWTTTIGEVAYNHAAFDVRRISSDGAEVWQGITAIECLTDMESEWEVIGNIYENSELLEVSE